MENQVSSERKVLKNFGTSKCECFESLLGDFLRKSWEHLESTSQRCSLNVGLGCPLDFISGRPQDVRLGRSGDGQIGSLGDVLGRIFRRRPGDVEGGRTRDVLGTNICRLDNDKDPKFKVSNIARISKYKNIFGKGYVPNWSEKVFFLQKFKILFRGLSRMLFVILKAKKLLELFTKKNCKKTNQKSL